MQQKQGYKVVKFPYGKFEEIPEEWDLLEIDKVTELVTYGLTVRPKYIKEGIPLISAKEIRKGEIDFKNAAKISPKDYDLLSNKERGRKDDVFYSKTGTIGLVARAKVDFEFAITQNIASLRPRKNIVLPEFLELFLRTEFFFKLAYRTINTTTLPDLQLGEIKKIKIALPAKNEQQKIASILSKIDELIQKTDQVIEQTQRLRKGLMQMLLTKGIGHTKFKDAHLCRLSQSQKTLIPEGWEIKQFGDIANINPESIDDNYSHDEILYIDIGSIDNYAVQKHEKFDLNQRPSRAQRIVRENDIIISTVRPYLRAFAVINDSKPNLICSTGFAVVRAKDPDDTHLIFNYVKSNPFEINVIRHMEGMAYPAITSSIIEKSFIPYPKEKSERIQIASVLSNIDSQIQKGMNGKNILENLRKGLMQKLLTGKIRVKV